MSEPTYLPTTAVTLDQIRGGWLSKKPDAQQAALIRAFNKLDSMIQRVLIGDAQAEAARTGGQPTITGRDVMGQGGDRFAELGNGLKNPLVPGADDAV